ncbi:MAG: general secretion pathway protein GspK [Candidatus Omnitrophica bacterium]|nr:general secretion pathway protein GspK [Candidatus Omnitrophota bacterium]
MLTRGYSKNLFQRDISTPAASKGSVLILAVWALLFLTVIAFACGALVRQEIFLVKKVETKTRLYRAAYSGALWAIDNVRSYYKDRDPHEGFTLNNLLASNPGLFKDKPIGDIKVSARYEYVSGYPGKKETRYGLTDEESLINVNTVDKRFLGPFFRRVSGLDPEIARALATNVVDWRDVDDMAGDEVSSGSERAGYKSSGYKYSPKNAPFESVEELLLVKGMDMKTFLAVRDRVTVFGYGLLNINTVTSDVLEAIGLDQPLVNKIIAYRAGPDGVEGTADDNYFKTRNLIVESLSRTIGLDQTQKEKLTEVVFSNILDIKSSLFRTTCVSSDSGSSSTGRLVVVFDRSGIVKYSSYLEY